MISFHALIRSAVAVGSALALSACVSGGPQSSPEPDEPTQAATWVEREEVDAVTMEVPAGWELVDAEELERKPLELAVVPEGTELDGRHGVRAYRVPNDVMRDGGPERGDGALDAEGIRDTYAKINEDAGLQVEILPNREIDGFPAYGARVLGKEFHGGKIYSYEEWVVRRPDGIWFLHVYGREGSDAVPADLSEALDTVTWTMP